MLLLPFLFVMLPIRGLERLFGGTRRSNGIFTLRSEANAPVTAAPATEKGGSGCNRRRKLAQRGELDASMITSGWKSFPPLTLTLFHQRR